jgi:hypothetical protein
MRSAPTGIILCTHNVRLSVSVCLSIDHCCMCFVDSKTTVNAEALRFVKNSSVNTNFRVELSLNFSAVDDINRINTL